MAYEGALPGGIPLRDPYDLSAIYQNDNALQTSAGTLGALNGQAEMERGARIADGVHNMEYNARDKTVRMTMDADTAKFMEANMKVGLQVQQLYAQRLAENQARQRQTGWLGNTLATIAGSLAANDPNPVTRGLGQAALRLNPSRQELQSQEEQLLSGMAGAAQQTSRIAMEGRRYGQEQQRLDFEGKRVDLETIRESRLQDAKRREDVSRFESKWDDRIAKGENIDRARYESEYRQIHPDATPQEVRESSDRLLQSKAEAEQYKKVVGEETFKEELTKVRAVEKVKEDERIRGEVAREKIKEERDKIKEISDASKKEFQDYKTAEKPLLALNAAEHALDDVEIKLKKYNKYVGLLAGPTVGEAAARLKREVANLKTSLKLSTSRAIEATGAGARGYGPMERGFFESLSEALDKTVEGNLGNIDSWRAFVRQKREAIVDTHSFVEWDKHPRALGKDSDVTIDRDLREFLAQNPGKIVRDTKTGKRFTMQNGRAIEVQDAGK